MDIVVQGPFRAASQLWQPRPGAWALTVACTAIFELAPGRSPLIANPHLEGGPGAPAAPGAGFAPAGTDDERRALAQEIARAPRKGRPEVVVVGHAHAPEGRPVPSLLARIAIGELDKALEVVGERQFRADGTLPEPAPFARMSLRWERTAGGPGTANPAGVRLGKDAAADPWGRFVAPNLVPVGATILTRADRAAPIGLGPIPPSWPTRLGKLGRYAGGWDPLRWSERPLGDDFDFSYFNVAPPDQHLSLLTGAEEIVLEHLHPRLPRLSTRLALGAPRATVAGQHVPLLCDTLVIDTDLGVAALTFRGTLPVADPRRSQPVLVTPDPERASPIPMVNAPSAALMTMPALQPASAPVLPFGEPGAPEGYSPTPRLYDPTQILPPSAAAGAAEGIAEKRWGQAGETMPLSPGGPVMPPWLADEAPAPARPGKPLAEVPVLGLGVAPGAAVPAATTPMAEEPEAIDVEVVLAEEGEETPSLDAYPLERCAQIAARLDLAGDGGRAVLEAQGLDRARWDALHARWRAELRAEASRGRVERRAAYDRAYVAELEAARGPIGPARYARLAIATERGLADAALAAMGLPRPALMRIRRVWVERIVQDARLHAEVRAALRAEAEA